ncbi:MAG: hypothetical protein KAQ68_00760 [Clostridiales bacterium]|nr:hypothetical protein [Clostridiales bacterium]
MKTFKRLIFIVTLILVVGFLVPSNALAADSDFEITVTFAPHEIAPLGGIIEVKFVVKNLGATPITWIRTDLLTDVTFSLDWSGVLAMGATKTLTRMVPFVANDLDQNISVRVYIENDGDPARDGMQTDTIRVDSEDNVFLTEATKDPDKPIFYVGETVTLNDRYRNGLTIPATDVVVAFYYRVTGQSTEHGDPIDLDDAAGGESLYHTFEYTFKEADIGEYRIGSQLTYKVAGKGPYQEYNAAHDFVVAAAPTPSPTPVATPEPTPTPTVEATDTATPVVTDTPLPSDAVVTDEPSTSGGVLSELGSNPLLLVLVIVLGLVLVAVVGLIIVMVVKKKK